MDLPGSFIHRIFQARILEWVAISFSRGSCWPRDRTWIFLIAGSIWATREYRQDNSKLKCLRKQSVELYMHSVSFLQACRYIRISGVKKIRTFTYPLKRWQLERKGVWSGIETPRDSSQIIRQRNPISISTHRRLVPSCLKAKYSFTFAVGMLRGGNCKMSSTSLDTANFIRYFPPELLPDN